jgi:hypothetical protein
LRSNNIFHWAASNIFQWTNLRASFVGSLIERDRREISALYARVSTAYRASPFSREYVDVDFVDALVADACARAGRDPAPDLHKAMCELVWQLLWLEPVVVGMPDPPDFKHLSFPALGELRALLLAKERVLADPTTYVDIWREKIIRLLEGVMQYFPPFAFETADSSAAQFQVSLVDLCQEPAEAIERTMATMYDDDIVRAGFFDLIRHRLDDNLCRTSGITRDEAMRGKGIVPPTSARKTPHELVASYLSGTPFPQLFLSNIPFAIPEAARFEHMHVVAGSGHGKTQLLQHLLCHDLTHERPPALVVIDSQGDMISKLRRLVPDAVVIDPRDAPQLNVFDINQERLDRYGASLREQVLNGVIDLYDYLFASLLGAELTQKQSVFFRYCLRLLLAMPQSAGQNATIIDLLNLMEQPGPYLKAIDALPPIQKRFFENEKTGFFSPGFKQTKEQIGYRLSAILENDTFARMLAAPRNEIDMFSALNAGKVVLVNTAKDYLKAERSSFLGRLFISLTMNAAFERAALPEAERHPAFLYIDEASEYFDDNIDDLLIQARKFSLGVLFSHQYLDQCTPALRSSIAANTAIKFAGGVSERDARALAGDMRTTPDLILSQRKSADASRFACSIRGHSAMSLTVPFGTLEAAIRDRPALPPRPRSLPSQQPPPETDEEDRLRRTEDPASVEPKDWFNPAQKR